MYSLHLQIHMCGYVRMLMLLYIDFEDLNACAYC